MQTAAQNIVLGNNFLNVERFLQTLQTVGGRRSAAGLRFIPGPVNRQIATIAAAQGSEYLLYALLESIGIDPFRPGSGAETKGLKVALSEFEEHLRQTGLLAAGKMAIHASSLRQLSNLRDQVVHKAVDVSVDQVALVDKAIKFASLYSESVLGRDVLA